MMLPMRRSDTFIPCHDTAGAVPPPSIATRWNESRAKFATVFMHHERSYSFIVSRVNPEIANWISVFGSRETSSRAYHVDLLARWSIQHRGSDIDRGDPESGIFPGQTRPQRCTGWDAGTLFNHDIDLLYIVRNDNKRENKIKFAFHEPRVWLRIIFFLWRINCAFDFVI